MESRGTSETIACPKCHVTMERLNAGGTEVDRCVKCGGIWLDCGELDRIMKTKGGLKRVIGGVDAGPATESTRRHVLSGVKCPRDASRLITMVDRKQTHVEYEACTVCGGIFMDCGELKDLGQYTLGERLAGLLPKKRAT